jgi:hypothetical protein
MAETPRRLAAAAALALCACGAKVTYTSMNSPPRPTQPRAADAVEVFMTQQPARPYVEVGMLEAQQQSTIGGGDALDLLKAMREEAGRQGCDGIIVTGSSDKVVGTGSSTGVLVGTLKGYRAVCIVFK